MVALVFLSSKLKSLITEALSGSAQGTLMSLISPFSSDKLVHAHIPHHVWPADHRLCWSLVKIAASREARYNSWCSSPNGSSFCTVPVNGLWATQYIVEKLGDISLFFLSDTQSYWLSPPKCSNLWTSLSTHCYSLCQHFLSTKHQHCAPRVPPSAVRAPHTLSARGRPSNLETNQPDPYPALLPLV